MRSFVTLAVSATTDVFTNIIGHSRPDVLARNQIISSIHSEVPRIGAIMMSSQHGFSGAAGDYNPPSVKPEALFLRHFFSSSFRFGNMDLWNIQL